MRLGEGGDFLPNARESVSAVGSDVLFDAQIRKKPRIVGEDFLRAATAIEIAKQPRNRFHNQRVGIAAKVTPPLSKLGNKPQTGQAALDAPRLDAMLGRKQRPPPSLLDQPPQTPRGARQTNERVREFLLFFRECHVRRGPASAALAA